MTDTKSVFVKAAEDLYELFSRLGSSHPEGVLREQAQTFLFAAIEGLRMAPNRNIGTSAKKRELLRIEDAARKLFLALEESHISTRSILSKHLIVPTDFNEAQKAAGRILIASGRALTEALEEKPTSSALGPPENVGTNNVTHLAAIMFKFLTGKKPTVLHRAIKKKLSTEELGDYGPFIDFLKAIYGILDIEASAAAQAREYLKKSKTAIAPSGL